MVDCIQPITKFADFAQDRAQDVLWAGKKASRAVVGITTNMTNEIGSLRAVAGAISSMIEALDLFGAPMAVFKGVSKACEGFNKGAGSINFIQRLAEFTTDKPYKSMLCTMSRVAFLVKDALSFVLFLEGLALISSKVSNFVFTQTSQWTGVVTSAKSIATTVDFMGWGFDTANNLADWRRDWESKGWASLSWNHGLSFTRDLAKLAAIGLTGYTSFWPTAIRYGALFTVGAVGVTTAALTYFKDEAKPPVQPDQPAVVNAL